MLKCYIQGKGRVLAKKKIKKEEPKFNYKLYCHSCHSISNSNEMIEPECMCGGRQFTITDHRNMTSKHVFL